jgi:hypothetical protein
MIDLDWKYSGMRRICDTSESWLQEVLMRSSVDSMFFCQNFMPDMFNKAMTEQRIKHFQLLDDDTVAYGYVVAARGFMKTTSIVGKMVHNTLFRRQPFTMFCSQTIGHAQTQTENVKSILLGNPEIREVFGCFKAFKYAGTNPTFGKSAWFAADPDSGEPFAFFLPKGQQQQVNGSLVYMRNRMIRPTLIVCDDLDDREKVLSEEQREKLEDWYFGALIKCVDDSYPDAKYRWKRPALEKNPDWTAPWRIIYQDTIKHEDALMTKVMNSPEYYGGVYPRCEYVEGSNFKKVKSCAPELWTDEQMQRDYDLHIQRNKEDIFAMDIMCLPMSKGAGSWTKDMYKYYNDREKTSVIDAIQDDHKFIIVDPSKTSKVESAKTAMLAVAFSQNESCLYFRDLINKNLRIQDIPAQAVEMAIATKTKHIFVELTGLEEHVEHLFFNYLEMAGLSRTIKVHFLDARSVPKGGDYGTGRDAPKRARASFLIPYYSMGRVYHEDILRNSALERQQLSFPKPGFWDALDCASYVPYIMRKGGMFFMPELVERVETQTQNYEIKPQQYAELTRRLRAGDWMSVR